MADTEKAPKASPPADAEKATAAPPAKGEKKTKLVAETGRYVCNEPVVYTTPEGKRLSAKAGQVVVMHEDDARALKKRRVVENEEEIAEG